jgi:hypothetical protein
MFKHALRSSFVIAFSLSITGLAAAHHPPSLLQRQAAAEEATQSSAGYRDTHARFGDVAALAPRVLAAPRGYRDIAYRFPSARPRVFIATNR